MTDAPQFLRKASLVVRNDTNGLDLSEMHFKFEVQAMDGQSPNNASIRVYNLAQSTIKKLQTTEFTQVTLQAGYENGNFGVIFDGTIRYFRIGRENATDTYIDILASDGDELHNFGFINQTLESGNSTTADIVKAIQQANGIPPGPQIIGTGGTIPKPRGKVIFGMSRAVLRDEMKNVGSVWSIQNGQMTIHPLDGYLPGQAVVLNSYTGLIGIPEQTQDGVMVRCLINPRIVCGQLVQIDNASVNQLVGQSPGATLVPYNQWAAVQRPADVTMDGLYRVLVCEFTGDTRGQAWYADLTCLAVDPVTDKIKPYG